MKSLIFAGGRTGRTSVALERRREQLLLSGIRCFQKQKRRVKVQIAGSRVNVCCRLRGDTAPRRRCESPLALLTLAVPSFPAPMSSSFTSHQTVVTAATDAKNSQHGSFRAPQESHQDDRSGDPVGQRRSPVQHLEPIRSINDQ